MSQAKRTTNTYKNYVYLQPGVLLYFEWCFQCWMILFQGPLFSNPLGKIKTQHPRHAWPTWSTPHGPRWRPRRPSARGRSGPRDSRAPSREWSRPCSWKKKLGVNCVFFFWTKKFLFKKKMEKNKLRKMKNLSVWCLFVCESNLQLVLVFASLSLWLRVSKLLFSLLPVWYMISFARWYLLYPIVSYCFNSTRILRVCIATPTCQPLAHQRASAQGVIAISCLQKMMILIATKIWSQAAKIWEWQVWGCF